MERGPGRETIMTRYVITCGRQGQVVTRTSDPLVAAKARQLGFRVRCYAERPMQPEILDKMTVLTVEAGRVEA